MTLNNGLEMPDIGMGTYPLKGTALTEAVVSAVQVGFRAFDTAKAYGNETSLGVAIQEACKVNRITRSDVFITSKIGENLYNGIPDGKLFYAKYPDEKRDIAGIVANQVDEILGNLRTDYLDLLLLHWPFPDYLTDIWRAMEDAYRKKKVRAIGVSNFRERHLEKIIAGGTIVPMVNQFELHPLNTKKSLIRFCLGKGIKVQAYSPLAVMNKKLVSSDVIIEIAKKYKKTIPQVILAWHVGIGVMPIPKSGDRARLQENFGVFDFRLTSEELNEIDSLNENYSGLIESIYCPGY